MPDIVETRWRALIEVEFTTRDYEGQIEESTARHCAERAADGTRRAELDVNARGPHDARVAAVARVGA